MKLLSCLLHSFRLRMSFELDSELSIKIGEVKKQEYFVYRIQTESLVLAVLKDS